MEIIDRARSRRTNQYKRTLDDSNAFCFVTQRVRTKYRQQNYVKIPYKVKIDDEVKSVSFDIRRLAVRLKKGTTIDYRNNDEFDALVDHEAEVRKCLNADFLDLYIDVENRVAWAEEIDGENSFLKRPGLQTSMHQLKGRHGLIVSLVLSLAVYAQLPLFALDFCHGIQNESSSQREGSNKHERHG